MQMPTTNIQSPPCFKRSRPISTPPSSASTDDHSEPESNHHPSKHKPSPSKRPRTISSFRSDLHRRFLLRRSQPLHSPLHIAPPVQKLKQSNLPPSDPPRQNGRSVLSPSVSTQSDPRFVPAPSPLANLTPSLAVTLFRDGYVRHDSTLSQPPSTPKSKPSALQHLLLQERFPYDRASRPFLLALDLGHLPPLEDLPQTPVYYDGCLVAEVTDLRYLPLPFSLPPNLPSPQRILLRPHVASLAADIIALTRNSSPAFAITLEKSLLNVLTPSLDFQPRPVPFTALPNSGLPVYNIARRSSRHRPISRPPLPTNNISKAALLLMQATDRHQNIQRRAILEQRPATLDEIPLPTSTTSLHIPTSSSSSTATPRPPNLLLNLHLDKEKDKEKHNDDDKSRILPPTSPSSTGPFANPTRPPQEQRLRTVRLVMLDHKSRVQLQQAAAHILATSTRPGEPLERVKAAQQQALINMNKSGKQVYILDMSRKPTLGCEIVVFRGLYGEKARDMFRLHPPSEEAGTSFLDQFKTITKKEGFLCLQDLNAASYLLHQQQQQQQQQQQARALQQQRAAAAAAAANANARQNQPAPVVPPIPQYPADPKLTNPRPPAVQPTHHQLAQQHVMQVQKQKQLHIQRQQQLQRQRQQHALAQSQAQAHQQTQAQAQAPAAALLQQVQQQQQQAAAAQQHPLQQGQPLTLQQQQILQQQMQHQPLHQLQQQQQNIERARRHLQQMQRQEKGVGMQRAAVAMAANGRGGPVIAKGGTSGRINVAMARAGAGSGVNVGAMAHMGGGGMLGNQVFPPHMQQMNQLRTQQMRAEHQRNLMAAVHGGAAFPRNGNVGNSLTTQQQLQNQALTAAIVGSAGLGTGTRAGAAGNLAGAEALAHQHRLQQHFKQQRENVEARGGKR